MKLQYLLSCKGFFGLLSRYANLKTASVGAYVEPPAAEVVAGGTTFLTSVLNWFMLTPVCLRRITCRWKRPHF